jgi:hypothetical protein
VTQRFAADYGRVAPEHPIVHLCELAPNLVRRQTGTPGSKRLSGFQQRCPPSNLRYPRHEREAALARYAAALCVRRAGMSASGNSWAISTQDSALLDPACPNPTLFTRPGASRQWPQHHAHAHCPFNTATARPSTSNHCQVKPHTSATDIGRAVSICEGDTSRRVIESSPVHHKPRHFCRIEPCPSCRAGCPTMPPFSRNGAPKVPPQLAGLNGTA